MKSFIFDGPGTTDLRLRCDATQLTCDFGMLVTNDSLSTEMSSVSGYSNGLRTTGTRSRGKSGEKVCFFVIYI